MNNEQFRRLVGSNSGPSGSGAKKNGASPQSGSPAPAGGSSLGSRMRASIPMTPRSVGGGRAEFARQLAAQNLSSQPQKQFRTSTPKGSRLADGYTDRSKALGEQEENEQLERIKALAELLQEGEIDQETFDKQRNTIASGDLTSTHLVKGLDFKLLERVRRGEDVYGDKDKAEEKEEEEEPSKDVDDAFDELEEKEVHALEKEKTEKKGQRAAPSLVPGRKRTRDQIIAEMKAARAAAKAQEDNLGDRFRKIGAKQKAGSRIERDAKGREVLIVIDEDGHEKRKVRKVNPAQEEARQREAFKPDESAKPLGMEVPEMYRKQQEAAAEEDDGDDIFADAGDDYDPLAGLSDSDDEEAEEDGTKDKDGASATNAAMPPPPPPKPAKAHNYFEGSKTELLSAKVHKAPSMADPSLQAAFKKAAQLGAKERADADEDDEEAKKRKEKHRQMLEGANRDDEDLDMGFGTSRLEDEEDFDDTTKIKLSQWGDDGDDGGEGGSKGGKGKRKRGPKKRKGDANNAADVLRVMEQRKQG